jgi:hypothetical protein
MDDLSRFCCLSPRCRLRGERDAGNLYVRDRYGSGHWRLLCCRACGSRFSERKGTALFGSKLPEDKSRSVLEHLHEGCGMRQTARLTRVSRAARSNGWPSARATTPGRCTTNWSLFPPRTREVQLDEKWAFVGKKAEHCDPADARRGDSWDHVAFDPEHRLVVAVVPRANGRRPTAAGSSRSSPAAPAAGSCA